MKHDLNIDHEKIINIELNNFKTMLENCMQSEYKAIIAQVIISHLAQSEMGLSHLHMALAGQLPELKYKVGEIYKVKIDTLPTWKFNKDNTLASELHQQGFISAKIVSVNIFTRDCYAIKCTVLNDAKEEIEIQAQLPQSFLHSDISTLLF